MPTIRDPELVQRFVAHPDQLLQHAFDKKGNEFVFPLPNQAEAIKFLRRIATSNRSKGWKSKSIYCWREKEKVFVRA